MFLRFICVQLLLLVVSNQILANPSISDSTDALVQQEYLSNNDNLERILSAMDNYDNFRQHINNKLIKRRAQAKANLAGLWGVPTRFA